MDEVKTAKMAPPSPRSGVALPVGDHPGNTGGKPGRSGRPPSVFTNFLAKMREDPSVLQTLEDALKDRKSRNYGAALKVMIAYDEDKPAEKHRHEVQPGTGVLMVPAPSDPATWEASATAHQAALTTAALSSAS